MQWLLWIVVSLGAIPFIYGFTVLLLTPGSILRKPRKKAPKEYVYQEPMLQRHTDKRKQETRLALSEWEVEFTKLDALLSIQYVVNTGSFVPVKVLEFAKKTDHKLYAKLQAHNDDLQYRLEIGRYVDYWKDI